MKAAFARKKPMYAAQSAMMAKPTLRQIERANAAMMPPENPSKLVREGRFRGWHVRVYEPSWLPGGARFFMCADAVRSDGKPHLGHDAEAEAMAEVEAWIRALPQTDHTISGGEGASDTTRALGTNEKESRHA